MALDGEYPYVRSLSSTGTVCLGGEERCRVCATDGDACGNAALVEMAILVNRSGLSAEGRFVSTANESVPLVDFYEGITGGEVGDETREVFGIFTDVELSVSLDVDLYGSGNRTTNYTTEVVLKATLEREQERRRRLEELRTDSRRLLHLETPGGPTSQSART